MPDPKDRAQLPPTQQARKDVGDDAQLADLIGQSVTGESTTFQERRIASRTNRIHRFLDYGIGTMIYMLSSAMHFKQQSNLMTVLGMWCAGSYLYINASLRGTQGPSKEIWQGETMACWLWMLSSFRAFQQNPIMRFAGISSYAGLAASFYYTARWMGAMMYDEAQ